MITRAGNGMKEQKSNYLSANKAVCHRRTGFKAVGI